MKLQRRNWSRLNYHALRHSLNDVRPGDVAVFDWDNTCAFNDIGEALLRRLTFDLAFRMDAATLAATVPDTIHGVGRILLNGRPYSLKKMKQEVFSAYGELRQGPFPTGKIGVDAAYRAFTSGLLALNRALEETPGIGCGFAYPWVNTLLGGWSRSEFDRLAEEVIAHSLQEPLRRHAILDPHKRWRYDWRGGIRIYPEMKELAACWQERGGEVVISTASNRQLVEKMVAMAGFPCREVIGMELAVRHGRFAPALKPELQPNLGAGKVANIRVRLEREPAFVAGDSDNDYEMLTAFPSTRVRLVIDRGTGGAIAALVRCARAGEAGWLAQAIDPQRGAFTPGNKR